MADNQLNIQVNADTKTIAQLEAEVKKLRAEFKNAAIGSKEFDSAAKELKSTLEAKSKAMGVAATENAKMMHSYFQTGEEIRRRMLPSMTAFTGILQDAPQFMNGFSAGMRSIGNNIEFFTQSITQAMGSGLTFKQALGGMVASLSGPGGIMFAVSAVTFGLQVLPDLFKKIGESASDAAANGLNRFNEQITRMAREYSDYSDKLMNREQDLRTFSERRLQSEMTTHANIIFMLDQKVRANEIVIARMKDKNKLSDEEKETLKVLEENQRNFNKQLADEERFTKAITSERRRRAAESSKQKPERPERIYGSSADAFDAADELKARQMRTAYINFRLDMMIEEQEAAQQAQQDQIKKTNAEREKAIKLQEQAIANWQKENQTAMVATNAIGAGIRSLGQSILGTTRQAVDQWDAAWLAMQNTAVNALSAIAEKIAEAAILDLFVEIGLMATPAGAGSFLGAIFSPTKAITGGGSRQSADGNSIGSLMQDRYSGGGGYSIKPSVQVVPIISNQGLAVQVSIGEQQRRGKLM